MCLPIKHHALFQQEARSGQSRKNKGGGQQDKLTGCPDLTPTDTANHHHGRLNTPVQPTGPADEDLAV